VLLISWNVVAVLGTDGGARASNAVGNAQGGSIDITAPVTTRQS
jgi:hypothetical protein